MLVGRLDAARGFGADALADEARRLVGAFADGRMRRTPGDRGRIADVSDAAGTLDGRDAHTVGPPGDDRGAPARSSASRRWRRQGGEPGLVLLAVAAPGPRQAGDATAADRVVRSLSSAPADAPPPAGRAEAPPASATPGLPPREAMSRAPVAAPAAPAVVARAGQPAAGPPGAADAHRSLIATPSSASRWRVSGRLIPTTLDGSPWMPSTNHPPRPSRVNAPATASGSPDVR